MYRHPGEIPDDIVAANIRALRLRNGWSLARLGERMGWPTPSTVCDAEGRRYGRQRRFTADEVARLAAIFGVSPQQLTSQCAHCESRPPAGFACLQCGVYSPLGNIGTRPRPRGDIKLPGRAGG